MYTIKKFTMKIKYLYLSIFFLFASISFSQAQDDSSNEPVAPTRTIIMGGQSVTFDRGDKSVQGSPYLNDKFTPAQTSASNEIFNVKYNMVNDQMEVENEKAGTFALTKNIANMTISFLNSSAIYEVVDFLDENGNLQRGYFISLSDLDSSPKVKLFLKQSKKYIERKPAMSSYQSEIPASFKRVKDKYFIKINENPATEVPKNKKEFVKLFPNNESKVLSFIKKNKIKISQETDLIKLANFCSSL